MGYITIRESSGRRVHELGSHSYIGRGTSCQILLDDLRSSKRHAEIRLKSGNFLVADLNSTNGTTVGGRKIDSEILLNDGDEIQIGDTTLVYTRSMPPGVDSAMIHGVSDSLKKGTPAAALSDKTGFQIAEKGTGKIPKGTMVIPLERFEFHKDHAGEADVQVLHSTDPSNDKELWLTCLYRLLREANQCDSEDDLFSAATRMLSEAIPGSRVRVLFEAEPELDASDSQKIHDQGKTLHLAVWSDPNRRGHKTTRILADEMSDARSILLTYARERCVALMSPDVATDSRVRDGSTRLTRRTTQVLKNLEADEDRERISLLIAPLLAGRMALGYVVVEQTYRLANVGRGRRNPFQQEHLEFLAAATFPLASMLERLKRRETILEENTRLRQAVSSKYEIVGRAPSLKATMSIIQRVAPLRSPVLILGESGTGKELVARAVHALSPRNKGPFEAVNCAALPENLIESELFGHCKGSFTGATRDRAGYFEMASGGTLFLDECGELPLPAQAKLLRVLEESKVVRVGESRLRDIDCRIVAATNRDLAKEVEEGRFRQDLYYRMRVMDVTLPPLRERLEDLGILSKHLLKPFGNYTLHPDAAAVLRAYHWPGNIRELKNTLERMAVMSRPSGTSYRSGTIQLTVEDVPLDIRNALGNDAATATLADRRRKTATLSEEQAIRPDASVFHVPPSDMVPLEELQVRYARWVLTQVKGNKSKAARMLGIQRSTLYAWTEWNDKKKPEA